MTDRHYLLSARDAKGLEITQLGPFLEVIFRPGSNWIEVQHPNREWQTISGAAYMRVLVKTVDINLEKPIPSPEWDDRW